MVVHSVVVASGRLGSGLSRGYQSYSSRGAGSDSSRSAHDARSASHFTASHCESDADAALDADPLPDSFCASAATSYLDR
jgi:hypothetical protein